MGARDSCSCSCGFEGRRREVVSVRRIAVLDKAEAGLWDRSFDRGRMADLEAIKDVCKEEGRR